MSDLETVVQAQLYQNKWVKYTRHMVLAFPKSQRFFVKATVTSYYIL